MLKKNEMKIKIEYTQQNRKEKKHVKKWNCFWGHNNMTEHLQN